jgi:hypothetical protein
MASSGVPAQNQTKSGPWRRQDATGYPGEHVTRDVWPVKPTIAGTSVVAAWAMPRWDHVQHLNHVTASGAKRHHVGVTTSGVIRQR